MRALVLWADDRSSNLGVRALGDGSAALVRRVWPDAEVEFLNFGHRHPNVPLGRVRSLVRERLTGRRGTVAWLRGFDLVVDTRAGDSFADIYGQRRLRIQSMIAELARVAGVPVVLGPQTIGPFDTVAGRAVGRAVLRRADLVMARDHLSADASAALGRPVDALTTDVVFGLPVPTEERTRDVLFNVSGLLWQPGPHTDAERYREIVRTVHRGLVDDGRRVSLLAHVLDSEVADNDVPALRAFAAELGGDVEVLVPSGLDEVRRMAASARLVIGSRMHACLNAISVGTPAIPLAYSRKFAPLLADIGWGATVDLRIDDPAAAVLAASRQPLDDELAATRATADALLGRAVDALRTLA